MVVITYTDLDGIDEITARRVISAARTIAPGFELLDGEPRNEAIAILTGVGREAVARGPRHVANQSLGTARVGYTAATSWFTPEDEASLRALVGAPSPAGLPVGSFPKARPFKHIWPDEERC